MLRSKNKQFTVIKAFNNNVVLVKGARGKEIILIGKGLGFNVKKGTRIAPDNDGIEKTFSLDDPVKRENFNQMAAQVDAHILLVAEKIIAMAEETLGPVNEHIHIALPDHLNFTLQRLSNNLEIRNPFRYQVQTLYSDEYAVAVKGAALIEQELGVAIPDDEIAFIALHLHSALYEEKPWKTLEFTTLIHEMVQYVREQPGFDLSETGVNYVRLVTHLSAALKRISEGESVHNPLLQNIRRDFPDAYRLAEELARMAHGELHLLFPDDEVGFLALHLQRLKQ